MYRLIRFSTNRALSGPESIKALEAAQDAAQAARQVQGVKSCTLQMGPGALVFVAESDAYAAADRALADSGVQRAFGRLGWEFGYNVSGDEFLLDPQQVYPFITAQEGALATA